MNVQAMHNGVAGREPAGFPGVAPAPAPAEDLLLREISHRCSNDLQLVVSLLALQSRSTKSPEAREVLAEAGRRVSILARARSTLHQQGQNSLEVALRQVCEALQSQAEPRGISVSLEVDQSLREFPSAKIMNVALTVNELATNAIKHAFEENKSGFVRVSIRQHDAHQVSVIVDDDGLPFPELTDGTAKRRGLGLDIAKRLIAGIGGMLALPVDGSKAFELCIPLQAS